jgi:hypothetical protein
MHTKKKTGDGRRKSEDPLPEQRSVSKGAHAEVIEGCRRENI